MSELFKSMEGVNGQLHVYDDKIVIGRKGQFLLFGVKGDKTIFYNQIGSIQFKNTGTFTAGYIQFSILGGNEGIKGVFQAAKDENTVLFNDDKIANEIKNYIESRIQFYRAGNSQSSISQADELIKWKKMQDDGIITEEEYNKKKAQLLS